MYMTRPLGFMLVVLAGCGGGGGPEIDRDVARPTAASGYAQATSSLGDPTETITRKGEAQHILQGGGEVDQKNVKLKVSATGNVVNGHNEFLVTYNGTPVVMQ